MKKPSNKQAKKASKLAKAENLKKKANQVITVKNAEGDPDTKAEIVIQNKISYTPKVSVIIPVYNVEQYLRECLDSVCGQTLKEIEIICVDDGSTDSSLEILKEYANRDNRITVMKQENLHAGVARNAGLAVARGEYLSFLDADDWFELNMLEEMSKKADVDGSDVVVCENFIYDEYKKEDVRNIPISNVHLNESPFQPKKFANSLFLITNPNPWTKLIKRNLFENNELKFESFKRCNDLTCVYTTLSLAKQISLMDNLFIHYRSIRKGNSTENRSEKVDLFLYAINKLEKNLKKHNLLDTFYPTFVQRVKSSFSWEIANCSEKQKDIIQKQAKNILSDILYNELFKPKVSVIIPVYNVEKYLRDCLDSAINQTLKEIEIICVNDGSTDSSLDILKEYGKKDSRIVIINQNNQGLSCSRNNAMKIAKGEYIQFLDSDDWIRTDTLEILYNHAKKYNIDMLNFEGQKYIDETKQIEYIAPLEINYTEDEQKYYTINEIESFITKITISACLMFYKKSFLTENYLYFPDGLFFEDNVFVHKALNTLSRFGIKKEKLYFRRTHSEQTTQKWNKLFSDYIQIIKMVCELYKQNNHFSNDTKKQIMTNYLHGGIYRWSTFTKYEQMKYIGKLYECIKENDVTSPYISNFINQNNPISFYRKNLETWFGYVTKKELNLDNPKTYNEKMQWLKLYDSTPLKTRLADKYLVRDWVKETIGEEYLIPLLGVYDKFDDIDFDKLPSKFVMKCNHGSGWNIIVTDKSKLDIAEAKQKMDTWINKNFAFLVGCELHYRDIKPKIIIEEYIDPTISNYEIQAWVFNNEIKFISVETIKDADNLERGTFYPDGTRTEFEVSPTHYKRLEKTVSPEIFNKVINTAKKMIVNVPYVRIDFIEYKGIIKFREMTFTSGSGLSQIEPKEAVIKLGNWIKLPKLAYNIDTGEYYKLPKVNFLKKLYPNIEKTLSYILLPYYLAKMPKMRKKIEKLQTKEILSSLSPMRVDIKNEGTEENAVIITSENTKINKPAWFKNKQGQGVVVETNETKVKLNIKAINDGNLTFDFRASDKRYNGERFAVWVDYKLIKIDGKEILALPIETWHDKPFRYSMPIKDGQEILVEIEQQHHKYTNDKLKDIVLKLNSNSKYIKDNINKLIDILCKKDTNCITQNTKQPSRLFSITKYGNKKVYRVLGLKFAFNNFKKDVIDNQEKLVKLISDMSLNVNKEINTRTQAIEGKIKNIENKQADLANSIKKEMDNIALLQNNLEAKVKADVLSVSEANLFELNKINEEISANKEKLVALEDLISNTNQQINEAIVSSINANSDNILRLQSVVKSRGEDITSEISALYKEQSSQLQSIKEQAQSNRENIVAKLDSNNTNVLEFKKDILNKYQELNYADLLHDSIINCEWLKNKSFSLYGWAANYSFIYTLFRILDKASPKNILEMGLGQTTRLTSQYVAYKNNSAKLNVCEHNQDWIDIYCHELAKSDNIQLNHCELEYFDYEGKQNDKYKNMPQIVGDKKFDLIIVDGPVGGGKNLPRSNIIDLIPNNLAEDFVIIIDDSEREGEQKTIAKIKQKLNECNIKYSISERRALKGQTIIMSTSREFVKFL